ncbi:hypothetical protein [uncultured Bradyrhizobium sp.]|uniref:hypothetical protein n=1 Tax=Bradyrhizobium sp. TaxID=376 RepID=UPI0026270900|nr:hypothetical protein [uncultured Bradyrhizobium sp.]
MSDSNWLLQSTNSHHNVAFNASLKKAAARDSLSRRAGLGTAASMKSPDRWIVRASAIKIIDDDSRPRPVFHPAI